MTPVIRNVSRRAFLKSGLASAAGLTLGLSLPLRAGNDGPGKTTLNHDVRGAAFAPNAFVRIGVDGTVTVFSKHLEMPPSVFYRELRLRRASGLLKQSQLSVSEIAVGCGFHSASHLSRYFQKKYGETPLRHRRAT